MWNLEGYSHLQILAELEEVEADCDTSQKLIDDSRSLSYDEHFQKMLDQAQLRLNEKRANIAVLKSRIPALN